MRKLLAVAAALVLAAGAYADIDHSVHGWYHAEVPPGSDPVYPDFNDGTYYTIDIWANVTNGDDWTSSSGYATIDSGEFFNHSLNDETPPMAALVSIYPAMEYDSFYCATEADAGNQPPYLDPRFAELDVQPQYRGTVWFDVPPNAGEGDFLIARYTIHAQDPELPVTFCVEGASTTFDYAYRTYDFTIVIPEPGTLALLGMGLALVRRR